MTTPDSVPTVALEPKTKLNGKILKTTLAGALVDIGQSLPGVLHISQISETPVNKVEDVLKEGQEVTVWVKRVRKDRIELTMIEPLAYDWKELKADMVVKGKVTRLETYGAFVDFGAERPGLIHVSELAHGYVKTAGDVVKPGDEVEAKVLDVDRRKRQIRLSMKALIPETVEEDRPQREERKPRSDAKPRKSRSKPQEEAAYESAPEASSEPELTAMQIAWVQAQERAKSRNQQQKAKRATKTSSRESEEIFNRTLEKRLPTGG